MVPGKYLACLEDALVQCDFAAVEKLVDALDPTGFEDRQIKKTLGLIRRKRCFAELEKAASLFVASGIQAPLVRRQWAQALLDQDRVDQGLAVLRVLDDQVDEDDPEKPEIRGLIGRGYKQRYVNRDGEENLKHAVEAYRQGWSAGKGDYRWHGINLVALLKRADHDRVDISGDENPDRIAARILMEIKDLDEPQVWDYGTAMEASLALGDKNGTLKWARNYARHPRADAFELGSTLRQLREVWQIEELEVGQALLPVIEYELLQREGGSVAVSADTALNTSGFEAVYGPEGYVHVQWLESLFTLLKSVARVRHCTTGEPCGTGFLIKGSAVREDWGEELVFITNAHVVSDCLEDEAALRPEDACAEFTRLEGKPQIALGTKCFYSQRSELDAWVCRIQAPEGGAPLALSFYPPLVAKEGDRPQRIFVIGHPKGGELVISLYNNKLVGYEGPYAHYKSPTEGGSSGSPVLSRDLKTFALHHRAREKLKVNEGILFEHIKEVAGIQLQEKITQV
ncbi:MAG: serine protease [Pseudomonadota bacterium]